MRKMLLLCTTAIVAAVPVQSFGQSTDAGAVQSDEEMGTEIIVSARKRDESIVEVPVSVVALSGADLEARRIQNFSDLQQFAPGFRIQESSSGGATRGFNSYVTRGIFPGTDSPDRQVVSIFIDGVPVGGGGAVPSLSNVSRVEVVNGPQSAYFGRSTFAGAVNMITQKPSFQLGGKVEGAYWNDDSFELRGQVEGPIISDVLAARVALRYWKQGAQYKSFGYGNDLGKRTSKSGELSLRFEPTSDLRFGFFGASWVDQDGPPAQGLLLAEDHNCDAGAGGGAFNYICGEIKGFPRERMTQPPLSAENLAILNSNDNVLGGTFAKRQGFRREAHIVNLTMEYDISSSLQFAANGGISRNKWANVVDLANRYNPGAYATFLVPYDIKSSSAEARIASTGDGPLSFLAGVNYFDQTVIFKSTGVRNGTVIPGAAPTYSKNETIGLFGSLSYKLFDSLTVSVEGRYQWDKVISKALAPGAIVASGTTKGFTPRVIVQYDVAPNANIYASYSEGTRPAQYNANVYALSQDLIDQILAQADVPLQVPEERLKMGEIGFKGNLLGNKLTVLLAAYYGNWGNRQVASTLTYLNPTIISIPVVLPAGEVDLWGLEAQFTAKPVTGLTLSGTLAYAETDIVTTDCSECVPITGEANPVGNRLPRYPAWTGSASAEYEAPVFGNFNGYGRVDYIYTGKMYATESNVAWLDASNRVNLRAGIRGDGKFIELFGTNIFDDDTPTSIARSVDTYTRVNTISLAAAQAPTYGIRVGMGF